MVNVFLLALILVHQQVINVEQFVDNPVEVMVEDVKVDIVVTEMVSVFVLLLVLEKNVEIMDVEDNVEAVLMEKHVVRVDNVLAQTVALIMLINVDLIVFAEALLIVEVVVQDIVVV
jgi:hypothetical protein